MELGVIGKGVRVRGEVHSEGPLTVDGRVQGRVRAADRLTIGALGEIDAEVEAPELIVEGKLAGKAVVSARVVLAPGARVTGEIVTPALVIHEGAAVSARIEMDLELPEDA